MKLEKDDFGESLEVGDVYTQIAQNLNPAVIKDARSRAWQWKLDLYSGIKDKFDLYQELAKAPLGICYDASPSQLEAHKSTARTKQVSGGWRAGKSAWLAAEILPYLFKDNAHVWIVANNYNLARFEWQYIAKWLKWLNAPITRFSDPNNGRWTLELGWGARLETQTADDATNIEGASLDCAAVAEAGLMEEAVVRRLVGRVAEKSGPRLLSGSLDTSQPWYMETFQSFIKGPNDEMNWHSFSIPSWENRFAFPMGIDDPEIKEMKASMTEDEFKLKVMAEPAKPSELVFPEFDKRIHVMDFIMDDFDDEGVRVEGPQMVMDGVNMYHTNWRLPRRGEVILAVDPGYRGAYAVIACRKYDDIIYCIDEVYLRFTDVEAVIKECKNREWWPDVTYAVFDIAAKQHQGMASHLEIWEKPDALGFRPSTNFVHIVDGIQRLRTFLRSPLNGRPRIYFSPKCKETIREFAIYRYRLPKENRPDKEEPIDKFNHSLKAISYMLMDRYGATDTRRGGKSERYIKNIDMDRYLTGSGWSRWLEL